MLFKYLYHKYNIVSAIEELLFWTQIMILWIFFYYIWFNLNTVLTPNCILFSLFLLSVLVFTFKLIYTFSNPLNAIYIVFNFLIETIILSSYLIVLLAPTPRFISTSFTIYRYIDLYWYWWYIESIYQYFDIWINISIYRYMNIYSYLIYRYIDIWIMNKKSYKNAGGNQKKSNSCVQLRIQVFPFSKNKCHVI